MIVIKAQRGLTKGILLFLLAMLTVFCRDPDATPKLPPLTITSVDPTSALIGSSITIMGTGFSTDQFENNVKFNGTQASVSVASETSLTVIVPADATTGSISVTRGSVTVTGPVFTVLQLPEVISITPVSSSVGSTVEINGNYFSSDCALNTVMFNGVEATLTLCSQTKLTAIIPEGATTGPVTVSTESRQATNTLTFSVTVSVYVTGVVGNRASYWKNGTAFFLNNQDLFGSDATSVYFHNNALYAAGHERIASGKYVAKYWKDGVVVNLSDGSKFEYANSIFVTDNTIFVAGSEQPVSNYKAKYWANGVEHVLTDAVLNAEANSIFATTNEVYVAGFHVNERPNSSRTEAATIWINGVETTLTDQGNRSYATSIFVSGSDVYVAGNDRTPYNPYTGIGNKPQATYWKNGNRVNLNTDQNRSGYATGIIVIGTDVYISGYEENSSGLTIAKYWKNGIVTELSAGVTTGIFVKNSDVYVSGYSGLVGKYWKNGVEVLLPSANSARGIFVK